MKRKRLLTLILLLAAMVSSVGAQTAISSAQDFRDIPSGSTKSYYLTKDIDLYTLTTPKEFKGTFNGNGHTISYRIDSNGDDRGLFSKLTGATVKNLTVQCWIEVSGTYAGGIAGSMDTASTITNCNVDIELTTYKSMVGGIVGYSNGTISNCKVTGTITTSDAKNHTAGGLAARIYSGSKMTDCYFNGTVTGNTTNVGMLVGGKDDEAILKDCKYDEQKANGLKAIGTQTGSYDDVENGVAAGPDEVLAVEGASPSASSEAIDTWSRLYVAISRGKPEIHLTADVKYGEGDGAHASKALPAIAAGKEITINLNGYEIDGGNQVRIFDNQGTLTLQGKGKIRGGYAADKGGAVLNTGTLNIDEAVVLTGNKAPKGGAIWQGGTMNINGPVMIISNYQSDGSAKSNVCLASGKTINVAGDISGSIIGVSMEAGTGVFTTGLGANVSGLSDGIVTEMLPSDNADYISTFTGEEAQLTTYDNLEYSVNTWQGLLDAFNNSEVKRIKLTGDIDAKQLPDIASNRELTIDLNGYTIKYVDVVNKGILTLKNSGSTVGTFGRITNEDGQLTVKDNIKFNILYKNAEKGGALYNKSGKVYLQGEVEFYKNSANYGGAIYNDAAGTIYIQGKVTMNDNTAKETGSGIYQAGRLELYGQLIAPNNRIAFANGHLLHIYCDLTGSQIGIVVNEAGKTLTTGLTKYSPAHLSLAKLNQVFTTAQDYAFVVSDGEVKTVTRYTAKTYDQFYGSTLKSLSEFYLKLTANLTNTSQKVDFAKTVYIDLNGYNIEKPIITNSQTLHIFNSGTADESHGIIKGGNNSNGGAISNNGGTLTIGDGVTFSGNTASSNGGAIYNNATLNITGGVTFTGNKAKFGGAIYNDTKGSVSVTGNTTFSSNTATNSGRNIYQEGQAFVFTGNTKSHSDGDVYVEDGSSIQFRSGKVDVIVSAEEVKVTGEGAMDNYESSNDVPWQFAGSTAKLLTFTAGPTTVGANTFSNFGVLEQITLPSTISNVASTAFVGCDKVTRLIFNLKDPASLIWDDYGKSFWEEGADMAVYVDKQYITDWQTKFPLWLFEDLSSLNLGDEEDPENTPTGIRTIGNTTFTGRNAWYTLGGQRLGSKPTKPGLYINNGRKVIVR